MTIHTFYKRHRQFREIMSSNPSLSRSRYIRLMAISGAEICGTIPLGTYYIVYNAKQGVTAYVSWAYTHSNYSSVDQIAGFIWKNDPSIVSGLELYRWSLILCSFVFFAFFGFADEARQHYRRVYSTIASRVGYSTFTLHGSSHACVIYLLYSVRSGSFTGSLSLSGLAVHRQPLM
jgi:pheromone a factor receptor